MYTFFNSIQNSSTDSEFTYFHMFNSKHYFIVGSSNYALCNLTTNMLIIVNDNLMLY